MTTASVRPRLRACNHCRASVDKCLQGMERALSSLAVSVRSDPERAMAVSERNRCCQQCQHVALI